MRLLPWVVVAIVLSGCATTDAFEKRLAAATGRTEIELIRASGVPQQIYEAGGRRFLMYSSSRFVTVPTAYGNIGNTLSCQITFEIDNGVIVGSSWKGNDCR